MSNLVESIRNDERYADTDAEKLEGILNFIKSLDWTCYNSEMVFGEKVILRHRAFITEEQAAEYWASSTYRLQDVRFIDFADRHDRDKYSFDMVREAELIEAESGEPIIGIIATSQVITPETLGDESKFANVEPPPESWAIPAPEGVAYLPFQRASIWELTQRPRCLLADDMGLGKTVQSVGMLNYFEFNRVIIIATAGLKKVWEKELSVWLTYDIPVHVLSAGSLKSYKKGERGIYIINYEAIRGDEAHPLLHDQWDQVIMDESHNIKNEKSKTAQAILGGYDKYGNKLPGLQSPRKLLLSGTPMPNKAIELWTTFHYLFPEVFTAQVFPDYRREFTSSFSRTYVRNARTLRKWFRAITIRRRKAKTLKGMPPKERKTQMISVSTANLSRLHEMENAALAEAYGGSLASVPFTQWSAIRAECARIKAANNAEFMLRFLIDNPTEKIVVFRHHQVTRKALSEALNVFNYKHVYYEGGMTPEKKDDAVRQFQNDPECRAIIVSIKAGGLGITLTESNTAVFAEMDCVPSSLLQCEDRLHRIGQDKDVKVTYLYIHGSIEEHMAHIVSAKLPQIESVVDDDDVKREHLVEAEINIPAILAGFRKDQQGWNRLFDIHKILTTATKPDGSGGLEQKFDWNIIGRFRDAYPEYRKGIPKENR